MKKLGLTIFLCLLTGMSWATFELKDPADPDNMVIKKKNDVTTAENGVIVPVGTPLYEPDIIQGECRGWQFDQTESATKTTYMGFVIKTIDCKNEQDGVSMLFAIVQIDRGRLIWVAKDKILKAN